MGKFYCQNCYGENPEGFMFCRHCGAKLNNISSGNSSRYDSVNTYRQQQYNQYQQFQYNQYQQQDFYTQNRFNQIQQDPDYSQFSQDDGDEKKFPVLIVVISVLVLLFLSFTVFNVIVCKNDSIGKESGLYTYREGLAEILDEFGIDIEGSEGDGDETEEESEDESKKAKDTTTESVKYKVITKGDNLNLRKSASADSEVVNKIPNGTIILVTEIKNNWAKTSYGGKTGWIKTDYIKEVN